MDTEHTPNASTVSTPLPTRPLPPALTAALPGRRMVVVGAGQIGKPLAALLAAAGAEVRWVSRRSPQRVPTGVTHVPLDASDGAALAQVAAGAHAILVAVNPAQYDFRAWQRALPPVLEGVIAAARDCGARLVVLENLYMYALDRGPLGPSTPESPTSAKGRLRKQLADRLRAAHAQGVETVSLRPSDFWGPGLDFSALTDKTVRDMRAGRRPMTLLSGEAVHAFSHRDDVVRMLVHLALGEADVLGRGWVAPSVHIAPRELLTRVAARLGVAVRPRPTPRWQLLLAAPFVTGARGLLEMLPQWDRPYLVDDRETRTRFAVEPVTIEDGIRELVAGT